MAERELGGYSERELRARLKGFKLGDKVEIINSEGKETIATIIRFYPHLVQYRDSNGLTFTKDYLGASKARLIKPSNFDVRSEQLEMENLIKNLGAIKLGEENVKKV